MNKLALSILIFLATFIPAVAQKSLSAEQKEEFFMSRVLYMQKRLDLTSAQLEKFIPVYRTYLSDIENLNSRKKGIQPIREEIADNPDMTSDKAYSLAVSHINVQRGILDAQQKVLKKLKPILTPQQLLKFSREDNRIGRKINHKREQFMKKSGNKKVMTSRERKAIKMTKLAEQRAKAAEQRAKVAKERAEAAKERAEAAKQYATVVE